MHVSEEIIMQDQPYTKRIIVSGIAVVLMIVGATLLRNFFEQPTYMSLDFVSPRTRVISYDANRFVYGSVINGQELSDLKPEMYELFINDMIVQHYEKSSLLERQLEISDASAKDNTVTTRVKFIPSNTQYDVIITITDNVDKTFTLKMEKRS
jgi:hypothetical protein